MKTSSQKGLQDFIGCWDGVWRYWSKAAFNELKEGRRMKEVLVGSGLVWSGLTAELVMRDRDSYLV